MKFVPSKSRHLGASGQPQAGFALILVLVALVIVSLLVIVMFISAGLERRMAASHLESQKARGLAMMAVDDVVGKLRDNIPAKSAWGVAPGRLVYWNGAQWARQDLHSGYSSGDRVALNVPLDANGTYSLLSKNTDFPNPPAMDVDWVYVFEDGSTAATIGTTKRVVGRYAYWTDVETSKVNLNTAGKAQIDFDPKPRTAGGRGDLQNLSGHPSSVDLSMLDSVTPAQSEATYEKAGISAERDYLNNKDFQMGSNPAPPIGRFSSVSEWKSVVGDEIYEKNKFDLTTQGRSPEYSPWAQNRIWLNRNTLVGNAVDSYPFSQSFNKPVLATLSTSPTELRNDAYDSLRFFVFPTFGLNSTFSNPRYFNWFDMYGSTRTPIEAMQRQWVAQLSRTDWPGFGNASFLQKWGLGEVENVAYNIIKAGDSMLSNAQGGLPFGSNIFPAANDSSTFTAFAAAGTNPFHAIAAGLTALTSSTGSDSRVASTGRHPLLNEIGLQISEVANGATAGTFPSLLPGFKTGVTGPTYCNLRFSPRFEFWLPPGFAGPPSYIDGGACTSIPSGYEYFFPNGLSDIYAQNFHVYVSEVNVVADGILDGQPKHYDDKWTYSQIEPGTPGEYINGGGFNSPLCPDTNPARSMSIFTMGGDSPQKFIYEGPFDVLEPVKYTLQFRVSVAGQVRNGDLNMGSWQALMTLPPGVGPNDYFEFSGTYDPLSSNLTKSLELTDPRLMNNLQAWQPSTDHSGNTLGAINSSYNNGKSIYGDDSKLAYPDLTLTHLFGRQSGGPFPNTILYNKGDRMLSHNPVNIMGAPNIGWMSIVSTGVYRNHPWATLSLQPATDGGTVPDWLILELLAMPYDQTYASHTEGKINLNASLYPWADTDPTLARHGPLAAVIGNRVPASQRDNIVDSINQHTLAGGAASFGLPNDVYVYAGQFCQIQGVSNIGSNDFTKEKLPRDMIGLLTTQSGDFKVHVVAQTLKQQQPGTNFNVTAEVREAVSLSRTNDFGDYGYSPLDSQAEGTASNWPYVLDGANGDKPRRRIFSGSGMDLDAAGPDRILGTADDLRPIFRYNIDRIDTLSP